MQHDMAYLSVIHKNYEWCTAILVGAALAAKICMDLQEIRG